jgi:hypothetical protein
MRHGGTMLRWFARITAAFKKPIVEPGHPGSSTATQGSAENAPPAVPAGTSHAAAAAAVSAPPSTTALGADTQSVPAGVVENAGSAAPDTADARIAPAAGGEDAAPVAPDTPDAPIAGAAPVQDTAPIAPDPRENQRRRELVRTFFNDFWSGRDDKPATFQQRLDQAETYLNERLAACGESWRFDADARKALSLPSRSRPSARDDSITS